MEDGGLGKYTIGFGLSLAITSMLSALLVVIKELNPNTVLAWMKTITLHHWVTHGLFDLIVFVAIGWILGSMNVKISSKSLVSMIAGTVVIGGLIIAGFYLIEG